MCLAGILLNISEEIPLLIFQNRDEFVERAWTETGSYELELESGIVCARDVSRNVRQLCLEPFHDSQNSKLDEPLIHISELCSKKRNTQLGKKLSSDISLHSRVDLVNANRTWFGINPSRSAFAFLTNIRGTANGNTTRGVLVPAVLTGNLPLLNTEAARLVTFSGYNLFYGGLTHHSLHGCKACLYYKTHGAITNSSNTNTKANDELVDPLDPGIHVIGNSTLNDMSWPRVGLLRKRIEERLVPCLQSLSKTTFEEECLVSADATCRDSSPMEIKHIMNMAADLLCESSDIDSKAYLQYTRDTDSLEQYLRKEIFLKGVFIEGKKYQTCAQNVLCIHRRKLTCSNGVTSTNPLYQYEYFFESWYRTTQTNSNHGTWVKTRYKINVDEHVE